MIYARIKNSAIFSGGAVTYAREKSPEYLIGTYDRLGLWRNTRSGPAVTSVVENTWIVVTDIQVPSE